MSTGSNQTLFDVLVARCLSGWEWRLNNLYTYHDQFDGQIKPFRLNEAQRHFQENRSDFTLVAKTRREGMSTYLENEGADWCIWNPGQIAALIDARKEDAKKKLRWVAQAWQHMGKYVPAFEFRGVRYPALTREQGLDFNATLRARYPLKRGPDADPGKEEIEWANGSIFYASTSVRGGMCHWGHLSELGITAATKPAKAEEILSGIVPAVAPGNRLTSESTHYGGKYGKHFELINQALKKVGQDHGPLEFKFLFFSFLNSNKSWPADSIKLDDEEQQIFQDYEAQGIKLDPDRRAYWVQQYRIQKENTFREFPLTVEDMFRSPVEGSIYGRVLYKRQLAGAVAKFSIEKRWPCFVGFDIGQRDAMALWLLQVTPYEFRWLDYYQASYENPDHFVRVINHWKDWCYIQNVFLPHDGKKTENSGKTYKDYLEELGVKNIRVVPRASSRWPGIFELRSMFEASAFHQRIVDGFKDPAGKHVSAWELLRNYATEVVEDGKKVSTEPRHDHTSNCCDSARCLAEARIKGWLSPHLDPGEDYGTLIVER